MPDAELAYTADPPEEGTRLSAGLMGGALGGLVAGALDGGLRTVGIDPADFFYKARHYGVGEAIERGLPAGRDLPGLLGCWAWTSGLGMLLGALLGGLLGVLLLGPLLRKPGRVRWMAAGLVLGLWLGVALFWWTRPFVLSGLPMGDPKRMGAAAALLSVGLLAGPILTFFVGRLFRGAGRMAVAAGLLLGLVGGAYVLLGNTNSDGRGATGPRNEDLPNVVIFVVDALRQDVLGCYGNKRIATPNIDRLAAEGVLFEEAFAQAPFTWPSFGSFLTGKYPRRHGLVKMDPSVRMPQNMTLPFYLAGAKRKDGVALEDGDFSTSAMMTGTVSHGSGLLRGFDYYYEAIVGHDLVDVRNRWSRFRSGLLPALIKNKITQRFDDGIVASKARDWMLERADRRFMSLVHLYSTHTTYAPSERFLEPYADPNYEGPFQSFSSAHVHAIQHTPDYQPSPEDVEQVRALYAGGVAQADAHIGSVVDALADRGVLDNTIVVVTSDHGESLGEDGYWEHNWMLQSNLRIPLIVRYPPGLPKGIRVEARVDSIDLVPTILDLMDLEPLPAVADLPADLDPRGEDQALAQEAVDGLSLMPVIRDGESEIRPYSFAENGPYRSIQDGRWKLVIQKDVLKEGKFSSTMALPEVVRQEFLRLFDLIEDPEERNNVAAQNRELTVRYVEALREYDAQLPIRSELTDLSARDYDQRNTFSGLGYATMLDEDEEEDSAEERDKQ